MLPLSTLVDSLFGPSYPSYNFFCALGVFWTLQIKPAEMQALVKAITSGDASQFYANGFFLAGTKFRILRLDGRIILGKQVRQPSLWSRQFAARPPPTRVLSRVSGQRQRLHHLQGQHVRCGRHLRCEPARRPVRERRRAPRRVLHLDWHVNDQRSDTTPPPPLFCFNFVS